MTTEHRSGDANGYRENKNTKKESKDSFAGHVCCNHRKKSNNGKWVDSSDTEADCGSESIHVPSVPFIMNPTKEEYRWRKARP